MKLNVTQVLKQRSGEPIIDNDNGVAVDATLRRGIINALEVALETDRNEQPIKRYERGKLADKVYDNDEVELSAEEITLIKERVGKVFNAYIVKVIWDLLEDKKEEK